MQTLQTINQVKTVAPTNELAICVIILCLILLFFSSFAHQTARESTEIIRPCGIRWLVIVITQKC